MEEKAIRKYNHVVLLTPMVYAFNLSGCRLLVFAYINGFCRDESSVCYSSLTRIAETIGYARRTVEESIKNLRADGYIYKVGTTTIDGQEVNGYRTYFYELMDRYEAGEDIRPAKLKTRRSQKKEGGEHCATPVGREQNSEEVGNIVREGGEHCATNNSMIMLNDNLSESAQARAEEEREFLKVFYLRNAGNPAEEVQRFVAWYRDGKKWTDGHGRRYETIQQRAGLAWNWDCKSGKRLTPGENTDKFYSFIRAIYDFARTTGDIDAAAILDSRSTFKLDNAGMTWTCSAAVRDWFEVHLESMRPIFRGIYGNINLLFLTIK